MSADKSNVHIDSKGNILKDISGKIEIPCPTCKGKRLIPDPEYIGKPVFYMDKNGNRIPHIECRTCNGEGWVLETHL